MHSEWQRIYVYRVYNCRIEKWLNIREMRSLLKHEASPIISYATFRHIFLFLLLVLLSIFFNSDGGQGIIRVVVVVLVVF